MNPRELVARVARGEKWRVVADGVAPTASWCDREGGCFCGFANIACSNYCAPDGVKEKK